MTQSTTQLSGGSAWESAKWDLRTEIQEYWEKKAKLITELSVAELKTQLAFAENKLHDKDLFAHSGEGFNEKAVWRASLSHADSEDVGSLWLYLHM